MALNRSNKYPGRFLAPTAARPQGAFKNRTSPTAQDGSYLEADWANDWDGFFARILTVANVTPNGNVDDGSNSQLYDALLAATTGRLLNIKYLTSTGSYTVGPLTKTIKVIATGGGGGGGGCSGTASATSTRSGGGGGGGGTTIGIFSVVPGTVLTAIVGLGGTGGTGSAGGGSGGSSSLGNIITASGGFGATWVSAGTTPGGDGGGGSSAQGLSIRGGYGSDGQSGGTFLFAGNGGSSFWGGGARAGAGNGGMGRAYGSGGGGVYDESGTAKTGGVGMSGVIYIEEYA